MEERYGGMKATLGGIILSLLLVNPAAAAIVENLQITLFAGGAFWVPGDDYAEEFSLGENHTGTPGKVTGQIQLEGDIDYNYEIRGGLMELAPCKLLEDNSYTVSNPANPKIAWGDFQGGATFTITGSIWEEGGGQIMSYGTILQATVKYDFDAEEHKGAPDGFINAQLILDSFSGEFATGVQTGWVLKEDAIADITLRFCTQTDIPPHPGNAVEDFASDITYGTPSVVSIFSIAPEPATVILLGLGSLLVLHRKGGSRK